MIDIKEIYFDPSQDSILGVFTDEIHVKVYHDDSPVVLIMTKELFKRTWDNWLEGKRRYCQYHNSYCGVGGYTAIEEAKIVKRTIYLNEWVELTQEYIQIKPLVVEVTKFEEIHNFEHG